MSLSKRRFLLSFAVLFTAFSVSFIFEGSKIAEWHTYAMQHHWGQVLWYLLPVLLILSLFHGVSRLPFELGLAKGFFRGIFYALVLTLPMGLGYLLMSEALDSGKATSDLWISATKAAFGEEVFFRAFIFGQLFYHAGWGFIPAALANALLFGAGELYQAQNFSAFALTTVGAVWLAWLFAEWKKNLWLLIFIHLLMNFYWEFFSMGSQEVGAIEANLPRFFTLVLSVFVTLRLRRQLQHGAAIKRSNLWVNREE